MADKKKASKATKTAAAQPEKAGKTALVAAIAAQLEGKHSQKDIALIFDATVTAIVEAAKKGGATVPNLGTFSVRETAARTGVKPGTSEKISIPAGKKFAFKASSGFKGTL
jgi:DNA-binding protein HU-beta